MKTDELFRLSFESTRQRIGICERKCGIADYKYANSTCEELSSFCAENWVSPLAIGAPNLIDAAILCR